MPRRRASSSALAERPTETFSDVWYRVAGSRPRLSVHARFVRQRHGPTVSYVIEDPAGGNYYRMSEAARFFVGMLDGNRTADEAWRACLAQLGDEAPTQKECLELLAQLQMFGLITGDEPLAPDMLAERQHRFASQRLRRRTGNWMFFHIPLMNPEPWLAASERLWRVVWGWPGLAALVVAVAWGAFELVSNADRLGGALNGILDSGNLIWLGVVFLAIRLLHELGHATACKAMGGRCPEIGVMMIAFVLPLPYCDATSSWRMPDTWRRVLVALGGMLAELFLAAIAAVVWATAEPGAVRTIAFNVVIISGVTTLLFNLNPLLRYDGYYILSDLAGAPNLAGRSKDLWKHLIVRRGFGVRGARPPYVRDRAEGRLLLTYHALAVPYRIFILLSILLIILGKYTSLGIVLAVVFGFVWMVMPLLMGGWYVASSPQLHGRRSRAVLACGGVLAPLLLVAAFVPLPASATVPGVVDWDGLTPVRADVSGYVQRIERGPGEPVEAGEAILTLSNPTLESEHAAAAARVRRARTMLNDAAARGASQRRVADAELTRAERMEQDLAAELEALTVRAPVSGVVASPRGSGQEIENAPGRFIRRGEVLVFVLPEAGAVVLAAVSDSRASRLLPEIGDGSSGQIRLHGNAGRVIEATVERVWPAGTRELPTPALGAAVGGEIIEDPADPSRSLHPLTQIELRALSMDERAALLHGRRAAIRFRLEPEPLLPRVVRRVQRLIDARIGA
ncbi:MAG: PqqD family peptide modification chaperone [Planctomycetota bacterium]